ncbi:hypothetical protein [Paraburkholderia sacchari]
MGERQLRLSRAILAMPELPMHAQQQAQDLLARLDRLKDLRRCTTSP